MSCDPSPMLWTAAAVAAGGLVVCTSLPIRAVPRRTDGWPRWRRHNDVPQQPVLVLDRARWRANLARIRRPGPCGISSCARWQVNCPARPCHRQALRAWNTQRAMVFKRPAGRTGGPGAATPTVAGQSLYCQRRAWVLPLARRAWMPRQVHNGGHARAPAEYRAPGKRAQGVRSSRQHRWWSAPWRRRSTRCWRTC